MTNGQLDQRVATLLQDKGWVIDKMGQARDATGFWMTPTRDLAQAMGLWAEHRPAQHDLRVIQEHDNDWFVGVGGNKWRSSTFADIPHAVTLAWIEAKEQEWKK